MKLIIAIVRDVDDSNVIGQLISNQYRVTRMASTGGFLRHGNVTLLIGTDEDKVQGAIDIIEKSCRAPDTVQHRATVFVVDTTHFEQV